MLCRIDTCAAPAIACSVLLAGLLLATRPVSGEEFAIRLSGVVTTGGNPVLAIIETGAGGSRIVRVGDKLTGIGRVAEIGPDWIRLETAGGAEQLIRMTGRPGSTPAPAAPPTPAQAGKTTGGDSGAPARGLVLVEGAFQQTVAALAEDPDAAIDALARAFSDHLHVAPEQSVSLLRTDFTEFATTAEAVKALEQGQMLRLRIGSGAGEQMLYVRYPTPEDAATADSPG